MCDDCAKVKAELWCKKCETAYCSSCCKLAHVRSAFKSHVTVPIDSKPIVFIECSVHSDEKLKFWCDTCMILVCRDCIVVRHQGHACTEIYNAATEKAKEQQDWLSKTKSALNQLMQMTITNDNSTIEKITTVFECIRAIITNHENELKQKIHAIDERNKNLAENYQEQLKNKQEELSKWNRDFERNLSLKNHTKLLHSHVKLIEDLKTAAQELTELKSPAKTEYHIKEIDQFQEAITDILQRMCICEWDPGRPLRASSIDIHPNARWQPNGLIVAGGNGCGNGIRKLYKPCGFFVDDDETVYIADRSNHRIVQWKSNATSGQVVAGGKGQGNGTRQLWNPYDVIVDKETDSLIICDNSNQRVIRWPRQNGTSGETIISNINCRGLTMNDSGSLYVVDQGNHEVRRYQRGASQGTVVAGGNGSGNRLDQLSYPQYIFVDRYHSVYVSEYGNHRVMKWMAGAKQGIVVAGGQGQGSTLTHLSCPRGIAVDQLGTVYVADQGNNRIMRWPKGVTQGSVIIGGNGRGEQLNQLNQPFGLLFDRHGNLYVVGNGNHRVQKFNIDRNG
ncbi:unnamed protein product [Rotaria magnacalcarata]